MKQQTIGKAVLGFLGLAVLVSLGASTGQEHGSSDDDHGVTSDEHAGDEHGEHPPAREEGPHDRAPHNINMGVDDAPNGVWLRAPATEWFTSGKNVERFGAEVQYQDQGTVHRAFQDSKTGDIYVNRHDEKEGEDAWWLKVSHKRLVDGRRDFIQYCASCHGFDGQGYGRSAQGLRPPPRDFTSGTFKFTKILAELPTDQVLMDLIKGGLDGTPMLKWDLSQQQLSDIVQYIKFLSPPESGWRDVFKEIGGKVVMDQDPYADDPERGVRNGERLYHTAGECFACHPGYASQEEIRGYRGDEEGFTYRDNLTYPELKDSNYMVLGKQMFFYPPDFTWHQLRSGTTVKDLAETIAAGIPGTAMPQWKGALQDRDIWAIAYYVESLITEYKDQPSKRAAFFAPLRTE